MVRIPPNIRNNPEAEGFWKRNAPRLQELGTLTEREVDSFSQLCVVYAMLQDSTIQVGPYINLMKLFNAGCKAFGLLPISGRPTKKEAVEDCEELSLT